MFVFRKNHLMTFSLENLGKNYKIEKEIGKGGMGVVYLATDKRLERKVAIKVLSLSGSNEDVHISSDEVIQRFKREAIAVAKLNHPNIVNIYDIGEENGMYYMVMEFVDGNTLSNVINETLENHEMALNIIIQVCGALDSAHEEGIIHRDIKPANIILTSKGMPKLMDFGIAQLEDNQEDFKITQSGSLLGSLLYISPEQLSNSSEIDSRADIYSLGMSLYEMLTGKLPFMSDNMKQVVMKILTQDPPPPSTFNPNIPIELDTVILKSLEKDVHRRYQKASDFAKALSSVMSGNYQTTNELSKNNNFYDTQISSPIPQNIDSQTLIGSHLTQTTITKNDPVNKILPDMVLNEAIIKGMENDFSWIENFTENWSLYNIGLTGVSVDTVFEQIMNPPASETFFSGAIVINRDIYVFVYEGYFTGAVDIRRNIFNQDAFEYIPKDVSSIELRRAENNEKYACAILPSIFNNERPFMSLDSSALDVVIPLIDNFSSALSPFTGYVKCYSVSNIYYYGFSAGKQVFVAPSDPEDDMIPYEIYKDLKTLVSNYNVMFHNYNLKPFVSGPTIKNLFKKSSLNIKYKEYTKAELSQILDFGNDEIPNYFSKELKQNLYIDIEMSHNKKLRLLDKDIDLEKFVQESIYYRFMTWIINEYLFMINSSNNIAGFKQIYNWLPYVNKITFYENLKDESNNIHMIDMIAHGTPKGEHSKKMVFLARYGKGSREEVDKFVNDITELKKQYLKSGDIACAFYISQDDFENEALKVFSEKTAEPKKSFLSLDATAKYKGFIKLGYGKGFHLNLVEYSTDKELFNLILPTLKN